MFDDCLPSQLEEMVADLRREKDLLRQANERLIQSTFDASRAQQVQELLVCVHVCAPPPPAPLHPSPYCSVHASVKLAPALPIVLCACRDTKTHVQ